MKFSEKNQNQSILNQLPQQADTNGAIAQLEASYNTIQQELERETRHVSSLGSTDGTTNQPDSQLTGFCEREMQLNELHESASQQMQQATLMAQQTIDSNRTSKQLYLDDESLLEQYYAETYRQKTQQAIDKANSQVKRSRWNIRLWWLNQKMNSTQGVLAVIENQISELTDKKLSLENGINHLLERWRRRIPQRKIYDYKLIYYGLLLLILAVEIIVNFKTFQAITVNDMLTDNLSLLAVGILFAFLQPFFAHFTGTNLANKSEAKIPYYVWAIGTAIVCIALTLSRIESGGHWVLYLVNPLIALFTVGLSYLHGLHETYFSAVRKLTRYRGILAKLTHAQKEIADDFKHRQQNIETQYTAEFRQRLMTEKRALQQAILHDTMALERISGLHQQVKQRCLATYEQAVRTYRSANQAARQRAGHPLVEIWTHGHGSSPSSTFRKASVIALLLSAGIASSCSQEALPATAIEYLYDQSEITQQQDVAPVSDYIETFIFPKGESEWGEAQVNLSIIGEISGQPTQTVTLSASKPFFLRNEATHRKEVQQFRTELAAKLEPVMAPTGEMDHSYIYRNLHYRLIKLSPLEGRRIIICETDWFLNEPGVSFYHYRDNPSRLWEERDAILANLIEAYPPPNLTGIQIITIHQPSVKTDELYETAKRVMRYHFEQYGASVEFRPDYPQSKRLVTAK